MAALVLGGVVFRGFELPERVVFPMHHRHHIHRLMGGDRVIDATGPDPLAVAWRGRFFGSDATSRARALLTMTEQGREQPCVWGSFMTQVLIVSFVPEFEREWQVRYAIECLPTVPRISGGGGIFAGIVPTITSMASDDLSAAIAALSGATAAAELVDGSI